MKEPPASIGGGSDRAASTPAVVVGCYTMGLGIIRSLGMNGVPVIALHYDPNDFAHRSRYVTQRIRVAHPERDPDAFFADLHAVADQHSGAVLLPASDAALAAISRRRDALRGMFRVGIGDWDASRLFIEKERTYRLADEAGVLAPATLVPSDEAAVSEYASRTTYPVLVKPSQSHLYTEHFKRKMTEVNDAAQLMSAYREARDRGFEVMLQEVIPGPDDAGVNYNSFSVNGKAVVEFTARKLRSAPARYGSPSSAVSAHVSDVIEPGRRIIEALGIDGFACTEFKLDPRDGQFKLMEVNGRHNLSSLLAVRCGIDFPWLEYEYLLTGAVPKSSPGFQEGVYWIDLLRDLATSAAAMRAGELGWREFLRPYLNRHVFAVAAWRDPLPFLIRALRLAQHMPGVAAMSGPGVSSAEGH